LPIEPPLVLDADFLSSFAWVNRLDLLEKLYSGKMIVLEEVMVELSRVGHLASRVQTSIAVGSIKLVEMLADSPEALELARLLELGRYGRGEAACMAYLNHNKGSMASNNLADVKLFCEVNRKFLLTTADVLHQAFDNGAVGLEEADRIWRDMIGKRRKLPAASFSDYLGNLKV
jgi:predicted nucleic acid-binding protein